MTSPTQDPKAMALAVISNAAQTNTATATNPDMSVYAAAGVTGVIGYAMSAYNSSLNTAIINGAATSTTAQVQSMVNAYNDIIGLSMGYSGSPLPVPTAAQFAAIGVTGVQEASGGGNALYLMDQSLFGNYNAASTVAGVQALANAANHVMAAAGGTAAQAAALSLMDFTALEITGVTATNLAAVQKIIRSATSDTQVDMRYEIQDRINANLGTSASSALNLIGNAAEDNSATAPTLAAKIFSTAGITGVDSSNLPSIYSALNSEAIGLLRASRPAELQALVDSYKAILQSADGVAGNTAKALTAAQYSAIGVTGVSGVTALHLLNDVVDASARTKVDTVPELQAMANAADHVMAGTDVSLVDLRALGISGVTVTNLSKVQAALHANLTDTAIDTRGELQAMVNAAITTATTTARTAAKALATISAAAEHNTAAISGLSASLFSAAGVTGVSAANIASVNSALDSATVNGAAANTKAEVQAIVNAYNAILASADGVVGTSPLPLTVAQYAAIGVTGVSDEVTQLATSSSPYAILPDGYMGCFYPIPEAILLPISMPTVGGDAVPASALFLLNDVVDASVRTGVDTVAEVQAIANAAAHVMAAAGGTSAQAAALSRADLTVLGIQGVTDANLAAIQATIQATNSDALVDTKGELQTVVNTALAGLPTALHTISVAAETNTATSIMLGSGLYASASVTGVSSANVNAINSALDSLPVNGLVTDTTVEVQAIVDSYNAILHSADGIGGNTTVPLVAAQYSAIGVTGVSGSASAGTALYLLNDMVDTFTMTGVDTVPELQAMATAAAHIIAAAGGTLAAARAISHADLFALGIGYGDESSITNLQDALHALTSSAEVDTRAELANLAQATQLFAQGGLLLPPEQLPQPPVCYLIWDIHSGNQPVITA
jgi:hypothetical protein